MNVAKIVVDHLVQIHNLTEQVKSTLCMNLSFIKSNQLYIKDAIHRATLLKGEADRKVAFDHRWNEIHPVILSISEHQEKIARLFLICEFIENYSSILHITIGQLHLAMNYTEFEEDAEYIEILIRCDYITGHSISQWETDGKPLFYYFMKKYFYSNAKSPINLHTDFECDFFSESEWKEIEEQKNIKIEEYRKAFIARFPLTINSIIRLNEAVESFLINKL